MLWAGPELDPESPLMTVFMPWLYHSWRPDSLEDVLFCELVPIDVDDRDLVGRRQAQDIQRGFGLPEACVRVYPSGDRQGAGRSSTDRPFLGRYRPSAGRSARDRRAT
jgi:hypothetical protein